MTTPAEKQEHVAAVVYEGNRAVTFESNVDVKAAGEVLFAAATNGWSVKIEPIVDVSQQKTTAVFEATFQIVITRDAVDGLPASIINRQMESLAADVIEAGSKEMRKAAAIHQWDGMKAEVDLLDWDEF